MNQVHIVVGDEAAKALQVSLTDEETSAPQLFVIKDIFNVGPLRNPEIPFSVIRADFWQTVLGKEKVEVNDLERLMELSTQLTNDEVQHVCFWMSGIPADVCTYFWLLHFLKKHMGKFFVININGLPFIDEEGKLFYPESISSLPERQVKKALKLKRVVSPSEWETDGDEWKRLIAEDAGGSIRVNSGGKQILTKPIDFYDKDVLNLVNNTNQKISKVLNSAMQKHKIYTGDAFLEWRLGALAEQEKVQISKENVKLFSAKEES